MFQSTPREDENNQSSTSLIPMLHQSCNDPQEFLVANSHIARQRPPVMPLITTGFNAFDQETSNANHIEDELSDDGSQLVGGEKKRRLNIDQVKALEKSFEVGNKLEPERKMQLARALGLQPRQIAIWFQNRRARWKTKQLEKDYEVLKRQLDAVKAENEALHVENQKLHAEMMALKTREPTESINLNKETEGSCSNRSENSSEIIKFDISRTTKANNNSPTNHHPNRSLYPSFLIRQHEPNDHYMNNGVQAQEFLLRPDQSSNHHHHHHVVKEESSLCNMLCGVDDQSNGIWPWLEPHNYN